VTLPALTDFVLHYRILLFINALIWAMIGITALYIKNQMRLSIILFTIAQVAGLFQYSLTIVALFMPLFASGSR
jgi:hypothetical protein